MLGSTLPCSLITLDIVNRMRANHLPKGTTSIGSFHIKLVKWPMESAIRDSCRRYGTHIVPASLNSRGIQLDSIQQAQQLQDV